jgi:hypothetical protein
MNEMVKEMSGDNVFLEGGGMKQSFPEQVLYIDETEESS